MRDFDERFETYMLGHTSETSRWMHVAGMGLALGAAALAAKRREPKYLLAGPALFFSCAWTGHLAFERNLPVGVSDPGAAFSGDLKMIWMMASGRNHELRELVERLRDAPARGAVRRAPRGPVRGSVCATAVPDR